MAPRSPTHYSRYFTPVGKQALASLKLDDLSSEIKLFRILLMRLLAAGQVGAASQGLEQRLAGLRRTGSALSCLAGLTHIQCKSSNPMAEFREGLCQAFDEPNWNKRL